jgi:hypothetical protein
MEQKIFEMATLDLKLKEALYRTGDIEDIPFKAKCKRKEI